jgi:hypothetical protein
VSGAGKWTLNTTQYARTVYYQQPVEKLQATGAFPDFSPKVATTCTYINYTHKILKTRFKIACSYQKLMHICLVAFVLLCDIS